MGATVGSLVRETVTWVRKNWIRTIVFSLASFVICWGWNIWLLARAAGGGGSDDVALTDSVATSAGGNSLNGIYWLVVSSIGFGLFTYGRERGFANAFGDMLRLPASMVESFRTNTAGATAMVLWGTVVGLGIGGFMPSALSGALGAGFVLLSVTPVASILNNILIRLFVGITSANAPNLPVALAGMAAPFMMMTGEALGLLVVMFADLSAGPALAAAAVCGVLAWVLAGSAGKSAPALSGATFLFVLAVGLGLAGAVHAARPAAADDGGWAECFDADTGAPCKGLSGIQTWWDSPGAGKLRDEARTGGLFGGAGAVLGASLGGILGSVAKARSGWKLPGGGFGTKPVGLSGQEALDVLKSKGMLVQAGDGGFQWSGVDGADAAAAKLKGTDLGGGKAVRVAVDAPTGPDGLVRPENVKVQAEVFTGKSAATTAAPAGKSPVDLGGAGAKVDPSGLADTKGAVPAPDGGVQAKGAFSQSPGGAPEAKAPVDLGGADAKVDPSGLADTKGAAPEGVQAKGAFSQSPGEAPPGKSAVDLGGADAKVDPSGLADTKAAAPEGVQAKGAFAQSPEGAPEAKAPVDLGGADAKVEPSGLADTKAPAGGGGPEPKSFGDDAPGGKSTVDLGGADAKVDPSGLAGAKAPEVGGTPRSSLPASGEVQAKGAFAQQSAPATPERVVDLGAPDAKVETGGLADSKGTGPAPGARSATPDAPPSGKSFDAPDQPGDPTGKVDPRRGGTGNLGEDVLPDEDRFDRDIEGLENLDE